VSAAVAFVNNETGAPAIATEIAGGGVMVVVPLPLPPQATMATLAAKAANKKNDWRNLIASGRRIGSPGNIRMEFVKRLRRMESLLNTSCRSSITPSSVHPQVAQNKDHARLRSGASPHRQALIQGN
jgi:hypothetical protein